MTHPIIMEIQLGKPVEAVVQEQEWDELLTDTTSARLPEIIKEIIRINNPNLTFAVMGFDNECQIVVLNATSGICLEYYEYEDYGDGNGEIKRRLDEQAHDDCAVLNKIVQSLYGIERKAPKPSVTQEEFVEKDGKVCPYCGAASVTDLDETYVYRIEMGCPTCGAIWGKIQSVVVTGFRNEEDDYV